MTESAVKFRGVFIDLLGEFREESGRNSNTDEVNRHLMKAISLLEGTQGAGTHTRRKIGGQNRINIIDSLVERTRWE